MNQDQQALADWQDEEWTDDIQQEYMASEEFLIDKLLVGAIDDLCRLIDLAKHRQGAKIIRERTGHLIMLGKNWTELWMMVKGSDGERHGMDDSLPR